MSLVFGEVAALYDDVRPGYPSAAGQAVVDYAGTIERAAEIGAGTGKATALFAGRGFPLTCVEPDERMAALLTARFPDVTVAVSAFEGWTPPPGGVSLLVAALSWHWLDPARRLPLATAALAPGGTLAILYRRSDHLDPGLDRAVDEAFGGAPRLRPLPDLSDVAGLDDPVALAFTEDAVLTGDRFLALQRTYGPFRRLTPEAQRERIDRLGAAVAAHGGEVPLRHTTHVLLARRPF